MGSPCLHRVHRIKAHACMQVVLMSKKSITLAILQTLQWEVMLVTKSFSMATLFETCHVHVPPRQWQCICSTKKVCKDLKVCTHPHALPGSHDKQACSAAQPEPGLKEAKDIAKDVQGRHWLRLFMPIHTSCSCIYALKERVFLGCLLLNPLRS